MRFRMKIVITVTAILLCVLAAVVIFLATQNHVIGTVSGMENEIITIDDVSFRMTETDHTIADRDAYLGQATNGTFTYLVYSVKNDPDRDYIYATGGHEGEFFRRITDGEE